MNADRCKGGPQSQCDEGLGGPICGICKTHHFINSHGRCIPCTDTHTLATEVGIVAAFVVLVLLGAYIVYGKLREAWQQRCTTLTKIFVCYYQILSVTRTSFHFAWPRTFRQVLEVVSVLGLEVSFGSAKCLAPLNYYHQLLLTTLLPVTTILVGALCLMPFKILRRKYRQKQGLELLDTGMSYSTLVCGLLLCAYAPVSRTITQIFLCTDKLDGMSYLLADLSLECGTATYLVWIAYALVSMLLYCVGIPAYFFLRLWRDRRNNRDTLAILTQSYEDEWWFYEVVELLRKFFLASIATVLPRPNTRVGFATLLSLLFLCLHLTLAPFRDKFCNSIQTMVQIQLLCVLIFGNVFFHPGQAQPTTVVEEAMLIVAIFASTVLLFVTVVVAYYKKARLQWQLQQLQKGITEEDKQQLQQLTDLMQSDVILANYQIDSNEVLLLNMLGSGSFGVVFQGDYLGTQVAVKRMKAENIGESDLTAVKEECDIMHALRHPGVLQLIGVCNDMRGSFALVLEFCSDGTLQDKIHSSTFPMSWKDHKMQFAVDIAVAMAFVHRKLVVHLDLKAENVMLATPLRVKLADFGTSKQLQTEDSYQDGTVGTPVFMAPEVIRSEYYDFKADVFSYSILLCHLHNRSMPHQEYGGNAADLMQEVASSHLRPTLDNVEEPLVAPLLELIQRCWRDDPLERPSFPGIIYELTDYVQAGVQDHETNHLLVPPNQELEA